MPAYTCSREGCGHASDDINEFVVTEKEVVCLGCTEREIESAEAEEAEATFLSQSEKEENPTAEPPIGGTDPD
jgi:hypothetical protein